MTDDERFNKWGEWIMTIHEDVENAILNRHIRHEVAAIIDSNPRIQRPSSFYEWMAAVYSDSGLMAVRRQLDIDLQSVSLARLLTEIVAYPSVLSRDRFVGLYRVELQAVAHREFDRHVGSGANNIDPAVVQAESDDLRQRTRDVGRYGTKRVAHLDEKGPKNIPTFQELDDALDLINALRVKVPPPPARSFVPGAGVGLRLEGDLPGTVDDPLTAIHLSRQSARESNGVRKKPLVAAPACLTIEL